MKKKYGGDWEPYELEALGGGSSGSYRRSRERLVERLRFYERSLNKMKEVAKYIKDLCDKNGGLPF
jgi:hypothetical protein